MSGSFPAARSRQLAFFFLAGITGLAIISGLTSFRPAAAEMAVIHIAGDLASILFGCMIFFIAWYGTGAKENSRTTVGSLAIFCAAILEFVHLVAVPGTLTAAGYQHVAVAAWVLSRLTWSFGLLYAMTMPEQNGAQCLPANRALLWGALLAVAGVVANLVLNTDTWPHLNRIDGYGHPLAVAGLYAAGVADSLIFLILRRRPADHVGKLPAFALACAALGDFSFAFAGHAAAGINIAGLVCKAAANLFILQTLYILAIRQPFTEALKLKENMERLAENNANLFRESEAQRSLFEDILAKVGTMISSQLNLKETLDAIADMAADMMRSRHSLVALLTPDKAALQVVATSGMNTPPASIPLENSLAARVCAGGAPLTLDDLSLHPDIFRPQLVFTGIRSQIAAPLASDGEIIGVIEAYASEKAAFTPRDVQLLEALGHHAGAAIAGARLHEYTKACLDEEKILYQLTQAAASTLDTDTVLRQCLTLTAGALGADIALGFLTGDGGKSLLHFRHSLGLGCRPAAVDLGAHPSLAGLVGTLAPSVVAAEDFPLAELTDNFFAGTLMLLPLPANSSLIGLFVIGWRRFVSQEGSRRTSFASLLAQQTASGLEKAALYNQVKAMALSDGLTGLANRRNFDMYLNSELQRAAAFGRPTSLIMLDLDKFKVYNDTHGHAVGDALLAQLGEILRQTVRSIDFPARYGGEEFVVILPECGSSDALAVAENIRATVAAAACPDGAGTFTARITASLGIATYDPALAAATPEPAKLIAVADSALYQAKQSGRNRVVSAPLIV